jgi:hypothetical protein
MRELRDYKVNPRDKKLRTEGFYNCITIHFTGGQQITYEARGDADFEEVIRELFHIVTDNDKTV